ncbi:hypothetical protein M0805_009743 [Coniferiporia weirii]|nr:hypothetical protein M0805_009743 [Coniferiporia weirii]
MGQFYDSCPPNLLKWIQKQRLFWVATAPLSPDGHVNVSPKGVYDCFHVIGPNKVWYEDLTGSGSETTAHLQENKRITIMFTAFDGPPRIVRLFGTGTSYQFGTPEYDELIPKGTRTPGSRAVIIVDVHKVGSSCGYSVPFYEFKGDRTLLHEHAMRYEGADRAFEAENPTADKSEERAEKGLKDYWLHHNAQSIDGLPSMIRAPFAADTPHTTWTRERGIEDSKAAVAEYQRTVSKKSDLQVEAQQLQVDNPTRLMAAFALGVLTTATLMSLRQLSMWSHIQISR